MAECTIGDPKVRGSIIESEICILFTNIASVGNGRDQID